MKKLHLVVLLTVFFMFSCGEKTEETNDVKLTDKIEEALTIAEEKGDPKALTVDDYAKWQRMRRETISESGEYVYYNITPQRGDADLVFYRTEKGSRRIFPRATNAVMAPDESFLAFKINPYFEKERQAKIDKVKKNKMPKDTLGVYLIEADTLIKIPRIKSFRVSDEGSPWIAVLHEKPLPPAKDTAKTDTTLADSLKADSTMLADTVAADSSKHTEKKKTKDKKKIREKGTPFWVWNPVTSDTLIIEYVKSYLISDNAAKVFAKTDLKGDPDSVRLTILEPEKKQSRIIFEDMGKAKSFRFDKEGEQLAFLYCDDTTDVKTYDLYYWKDGRRKAKLQISEDNPGIQNGWCVSNIRFPRFSDDGKRLYFGTMPIPYEDPEDTLLKNEKVNVDIWSWTDPLLQTQQKKNLPHEKKRNYIAYCKPGSRRVIQLADTLVPSLKMDRKWENDIILGESNLPYRQLISWESLDYYDYYIVDAKSGEKSIILEKKSFSPQLSPKGKYIVWFDHKDNQWHVKTVKSGAGRCLTDDLDVAFYNERHDKGYSAPPYGLAGWGQDDRYVFIYDRYDIWKFDLSGETDPVNITGGVGRQVRNKYRYSQLDREMEYIPEEDVLVSVFNEKTKKAGYASVNFYNNDRPEHLIYTDHKYQDLAKAKNADVIIWRRGDYRHYPDVYVSDIDFSKNIKISALNPQQSQYRWADVELVEWTNSKGDSLQGMLYIPDSLDKSQKHPMIVYYYERYSDYYHQYFTPTPSYSTVNKAMYPSNGYILFIPDIVYEVGHPGKSGLDCVMSGIDMLLDNYSFIDEEKMALQGQSWGGYQTAYFITQTDRFAAAMAGAPVSNMTSAYGGIRWGSGLSRMMQYEEGQSRIGGTLWDSFDLYVENSPIFFADQIETPLLMMHNDNDGAVPWTQGIEMMVAMRRLQKPCWMLTYNNASHNLSPSHWGNRVDLTIRMKQFFDHYLKDEPAPRWMKEGVSALEKGRDLKYEPVNGD